jgi:hypothetical protein
MLRITLPTTFGSPQDREKIEYCCRVRADCTWMAPKPTSPHVAAVVVMLWMNTVYNNPAMAVPIVRVVILMHTATAIGRKKTTLRMRCKTAKFIVGYVDGIDTESQNGERWLFRMMP